MIDRHYAPMKSLKSQINVLKNIRDQKTNL